MSLEIASLPDVTTIGNYPICYAAPWLYETVNSWPYKNGATAVISNPTNNLLIPFPES